MRTYMQTDEDMMNQGVTFNKCFRQGIMHLPPYNMLQYYINPYTGMLISP